MEKSLSVDNLFGFVIIIGAFAFPSAQHPKVLTIGIVIALVLRALLIALGAALLELFTVMFLIFGLTLVAATPAGRSGSLRRRARTARSACRRCS